MRPLSICAVLTTFNRRELLRGSLASVRNQSRPPEQIVIVDDGSTDGTREELEGSEGIDYHWQLNAGTSTARNNGWRMARADWIAFLDSDDLWERDKLFQQEAAVVENPELEAVFGHAMNFTDAENESPYDAEKHRLSHSIPAWLPGAVLIRRSVLEEMNGFDSRLEISEVVEWIMRLRQRETKTLMLPHIVLHRRLHPGNKRLKSEVARREDFNLLRRWIEQRREQREHSGS